MVVFGGSYGIGGDIAALARHYGAKVCTFSRSTTGTHVERHADIAGVADQVLAETGRIDFVVNTAGVLVRGPLGDTTEETIYSSTDVNYLAPIFIAQEFFPHLAATGGSLLLFTSSSYTRGRSGYSLYSSAKAAIVNLTQALADEWARPAYGSTASTRSGPGRRCAPRRSARNRPARCCPPRRWPASRWTCCSPGRRGTSSTSAARTVPLPWPTADPPPQFRTLRSIFALHA